ncbi:MAG TPA: peptidylprolyl isomerase [Terriglobia bacterium]|nr:peptidylprolyl isomerase [Terriglobia bacterium]
MAALALTGLALLTACNQKTNSTREIWAEVDGKPIYRDQVERQYRRQTQAGSDAGSPVQALTFKLNILNELINNQILVDHASHARISVAETEVDSKLAQLQVAFTPDEFLKKIREQGLELSDVRDELRESLIIEKLINKEITSQIKITDEEIADFYKHNEASFNVPETQYHMAQIQVTPVKDAQVRNLKNDDAQTPAAAERKIQALYARLRNGEDFATVAQEYSEDPRTSVGGGDMGFVPASSLAGSPILKQVLSSLKPGEISGIVRTPAGFHIFKLLAVEEPGQHLLSDPSVQSAIRRNLTNEKNELMKSAYIEDLRDQVKVVNNLSRKVVAAAGNPTAVD